MVYRLCTFCVPKYKYDKYLWIQIDTNKYAQSVLSLYFHGIMTDTLGRMHSDAQFAGSSSVPAHVEMMGLIGAGNNPMVGMTVAVAVAIEESAKEGKF